MTGEREGGVAPGKRTLTAGIQRREDHAPAPARDAAPVGDATPHDDPFWFATAQTSGLPAELRGGLEEMSGFDLGGVTVTRNSGEPEAMNARAFARGEEIHLGPGNEADLPHEAWHVVQQMQGRVAATRQHAGNAVNDDAGLEREADEMGARAARGATGAGQAARTAVGGAPTVQRMVHDGTEDDEGDEIADKREVFNQIRNRLVIHADFIDTVLTRIQRLIAETDNSYTLDQVIDVLVNHGLATHRAVGDAPAAITVPGDPRAWVDHEFDEGALGGKRIGGKSYTRIDGGKFNRTGDDGVWRVKDSVTQRGYAETELIGGLLYARIVGQGCPIELHYQTADGHGVIVKQHVEGYRNWANGGEDFSQQDYDARGLGAIAVAAWFLGEHDMHTANFGPVGGDEAPPLTVVDGSGALHDDNLERAVLKQDYQRLPLPPRDWTHSTSGWQMHDRSTEAEPTNRQLALSDKVQARLPAEKLDALRVIAALDFTAVTQQILTCAFLGGVPLRDHDDVEDVHVCREWLRLRPKLLRRQARIQLILQQLGG